MKIHVKVPSQAVYLADLFSPQLPPLVQQY